MPLKKLLPYGVKDYYPPEAQKLEEIFDLVRSELKLWGYRPIKLPSLEFKELFETALGEPIKDDFTTWECEGEGLLALRYDFTPQILRFVLNSKKRTYPVRIYYGGETFKSSRELWEESSIGFELVGSSSPEADAEVVALLKTILQRLGLEDYRIVLGHRRAWDRLVELVGAEAAQKKRFDPRLKEFYSLTSPSKVGGENLPPEVKEEVGRLARLLSNHSLLDGKILFSPSLKPERDYYCGIFFTVYAQGGIIARGGRYDRLFERFGESIPAVGCGIKLTPLLELVNPSRRAEGIYIIDATPSKELGWKLAKLLRDRGIPAERDIVARDPLLSLEAARAKGYEVIALVGDKKVEGTIKIDPSLDPQQALEKLTEALDEVKGR